MQFQEAGKLDSPVSLHYLSNMKDNQLAFVNRKRLSQTELSNRRLTEMRRRSGRDHMAEQAERGLVSQLKDGKYIAEKRTFI